MKVSLPSASSPSYSAFIPFLEMMELMGPVIDSTEFTKASSSDMPWASYLLNKLSTMPCTAPKITHLSP